MGYVEIKRLERDFWKAILQRNIPGPSRVRDCDCCGKLTIHGSDVLCVEYILARPHIWKIMWYETICNCDVGKRFGDTFWVASHCREGWRYILFSPGLKFFFGEFF